MSSGFGLAMAEFAEFQAAYLWGFEVVEIARHSTKLRLQLHINFGLSRTQSLLRTVHPFQMHRELREYRRYVWLFGYLLYVYSYCLQLHLELRSCLLCASSSRVPANVYSRPGKWILINKYQVPTEYCLWYCIYLNRGHDNITSLHICITLYKYIKQSVSRQMRRNITK